MCLSGLIVVTRATWQFLPAQISRHGPPRVACTVLLSQWNREIYGQLRPSMSSTVSTHRAPRMQGVDEMEEIWHDKELDADQPIHAPKQCCRQSELISLLHVDRNAGLPPVQCLPCKRHSLFDASPLISASFGQRRRLYVRLLAYRACRALTRARSAWTSRWEVYCAAICHVAAIRLEPRE